VPNRTRGWVNGRRIGLDGFAKFAPNLVWVATSRTGSAPLFLLVVPPDTPPERAAELLRRAGTDEHPEGPAEMTSGATPAAPAAPEQRMVAPRG
jgi:hypothetical protein